MKQEIKERVEKIRKGEVPEGYKETKVGIIPDDWDVKELIQYANKISDGIHTTPEYVINSEYFFINGNNLKKNKVVITEGTKCVNEKEYIKHKRELNKNSILISINGTIGECAFYQGEKVILGKSAAYINCKDEHDVPFIFYNLHTARSIYHFFSELTGSTIMNLSLKSLKETPIPSPEINERKKIAEILFTWDTAIELKEKLIDEKKVFKSGLRKRLLSGGVRFKEFNGAWQEFKLNEVVKKIKGTVVQASSNGNMPIIDMNYIDCRIPKSYSDNGTIASKDDVLILWDGSGAGKTFTSFEGVVGSTIAILKCNSVNNIFLQQHMDMNLKRIQLIREGSGIPHVPKDLLNYYNISLPGSKEQEKIVKFLNIVDKDILNIGKELSQLEEQKRGLMQLLLTGIVRVEVN